MNHNKSSHTLQDFSFYKSAIHFSCTNEPSFCVNYTFKLKFVRINEKYSSCDDYLYLYKNIKKQY